MQEQLPGIIDVPSIDFGFTLQDILVFLSSNHPTIFYIMQKIITLFITLSLPFSVLMIVLIIIFTEKLRSIRRKEEEMYNAKVDKEYKEDTVSAKGNVEMAKKWEMVLKHVESPNENDWRQSVIEADIILGDLLTNLGYRGQGIGEQLKRANKSDFKTLSDAWEAHKVRNELAHSGSEIPFSQFEARRVIQLYRKVFEEFFHI
jgi:hypothetical protein